VILGETARTPDQGPTIASETIQVAAGEGASEGVEPDGVVRIGSLSPDKLLVVADAVAKSAALEQDERQVAKVFDTIEPWARKLSDTGRTSSASLPAWRTSTNWWSGPRPWAASST